MVRSLRVSLLALIVALVLLNLSACNRFDSFEEPLPLVPQEETVAAETTAEETVKEAPPKKEAIAKETIEPTPRQTPETSPPPAEPTVNQKPKKLNTLVTELLSIEYAWQDPGTNEYTFTNPRKGWVYLEMTAYVPYGGQVTTTLKTHEQTTTISHKPAGKPTVKLMRYLPPGNYTVTTDIQKQCPLELAVRAVPELVFCKFRYEPWVESFGPYDWAFLEKHYLDNINCIIGDEFVEKNKPLIDYWRGQGKKWIVEQRVIAAGQMMAWEQYLIEKPTEKEANDNIIGRLKDGILQRKKLVPGSEKNIILVLGSELLITAETFSVYPEVDWKVYIDMQHNLIANDPAFEGLGGIQHYTCGYTDEESLRWIAKLIHHYYIEGNTEMLSEKYGFKYELDHIENPDFADGTNNWHLRPAEDGSITTKQHKGYGKFQGRWGFKSDRGDTFLWTKRSLKKPNIIRQQIKNLIPGKFYSVKVVVGDYNELQTGKSNMKLGSDYTHDQYLDAKAKLKPHAVSVRIKDAETISHKSFVEPAPSLYSGKLDNIFSRENRYTFNYHYKVFKAKGPTAELVISDWKNNKEPKGPQNQELIYNFIEVQPYFNEEL